MGKKKHINPNKIPIQKDSVDIHQLLTAATDYNVYRAWILTLGAMADYYDTTTDQLVHIWHVANDYAKTIKTYEDVANEMEVVARVLGRKRPYEHISTTGIKTQGDLDKLKRKLHRNAMYAGFSIIAYPIIRDQLLDEERIKAVFDRAYSHDEEVYDKRISLEDIESVLVDEYKLLLTHDNGNVFLKDLRCPQTSSLPPNG